MTSTLLPEPVIGALVAHLPAGLLASIPSPGTDRIELGPLTVRFYGIMIALGVLAAVWLAARRWEQRGGDPDDITAIAVVAVPAGLVGARLYHVITDWHRFSDDLGGIVRIDEGGLGIPGGMAAGILAGVWVVRRRRLPVPDLLDVVAPALPLAQAIGRWGNWFNQELFGRPTDLPWGLEIDPEHRPAEYATTETFHPTFLYESLWNLALVGLMLWLDKRGVVPRGRLLAVWVIGYGLGRFWIEALRIDPATEVLGLRVNLWVAGVAVIGGAVALWWPRGRGAPTDAAAGPGTGEPDDSADGSEGAATDGADESDSAAPDEADGADEGAGSGAGGARGDDAGST